MKKLLLAILLISSFSCKKESYHCFECHSNNGSNQPIEMCNISENEANRWANDANYTCTKK
jgi:hypothetical protein